MDSDLQSIVATARYYARTAELLCQLSRHVPVFTEPELGDRTAQTAHAALGVLGLAEFRASKGRSESKATLDYCRRRRGEAGRYLAETLSYVLEEFIEDEVFGNTEAAIEVLADDYPRNVMGGIPDRIWKRAWGMAGERLRVEATRSSENEPAG